MLAITPAAMLRLSAVKAAPVRKLPRHRRAAIRDICVLVMREIEPTAFAAEGPCRAGIRSRLCIDGWPWGQADAEAAKIVQAALDHVGAKRPTWEQGQPEYTQQTVLPILRERCARCGKPLPEENYRFCGPVCARAAMNDRNRRRDREERNVKERLYWAAWSKRQPERTCPICERAFQPKRPHSKYCSRTCYSDALRLRNIETGALRRLRRAGRRKVPDMCEPL